MRLDRIGVDESVAAVFPPERLVERLADATAETSVDVTGVDGSPGSLADCDAVVTFEHRDAFLDLEWVHSIQAGVDRFPHDRLRERGVALTNSTGIHGDAVGETVAGFVLALARRVHRHAANQADREWDRPAWDEAWTVAGERACVVGLGGLGRGIVDRLTGLGLDVHGVRRDPLPEPGVDRVYTTDRLREAVAGARFVVLAVPLTDATRGLVGADELAAMDEDAYLVNVARGGVVDQPALVAALRDGEIAGAALDVFETEPLPEDSPLWDLDDVIVSPHCAAYTRDYYRHVAAIVAESARRVADGDEPVNRVL
ncbi:D-2-hydroxyacid dehydrogenase [Halosimplex halophilum]|uniref:D-2-hydroxyacid dehydrogenase n=1 Tax=Halosimplex halophilum TaxID=2559572 RepID=UPI00107FA7A1|nr:D-2-hydroxyacid dehydrogenase [Halosimplex halophilum]